MADFSSFAYAIKWSDTEYFDFAMTINGAPADLTGATVYLTAKRRLSDTDAAAVINKTGTITNAAGGIGHFALVPADTLSQPNWYQVLWADAVALRGGEVFTTKSGTLTIQPRVRVTVP